MSSAGLVIFLWIPPGWFLDEWHVRTLTDTAGMKRAKTYNQKIRLQYHDLYLMIYQTLESCWCFSLCVSTPSEPLPGSLVRSVLAAWRDGFLKCLKTWDPQSSLNLLGGIPTPLKNMSSSVGMMTFPTEWKVIKKSSSKPPTSRPSGKQPHN